MHDVDQRGWHDVFVEGELGIQPPADANIDVDREAALHDSERLPMPSGPERRVGNDRDPRE